MAEAARRPGGHHLNDKQYIDWLEAELNRSLDTIQRLTVPPSKAYVALRQERDDLTKQVEDREKQIEELRKEAQRLRTAAHDTAARQQRKRNAQHEERGLMQQIVDVETAVLQIRDDVHDEHRGLAQQIADVKTAVQQIQDDVQQDREGRRKDIETIQTAFKDEHEGLKQILHSVAASLQQYAPDKDSPQACDALAGTQALRDDISKALVVLVQALSQTAESLGKESRANDQLRNVAQKLSQALKALNRI